MNMLSFTDALRLRAAIAESSTSLVRFSTQNISEADGYSIAAVGLLIVFFALIIVTMFISVLPRLLGHLASVLPEEVPSHELVSSARADDDAGAIAAIGYLLHARRKGGGDG